MDCNDATLQSQMYVTLESVLWLKLLIPFRCLGSSGQLGFCVAAGDAMFPDNGGMSLKELTSRPYDADGKF